MDFRYSQDQLDLIDAAANVLSGENTVERLRAFAADPTTICKSENSLWQQFAELGLFGFMAPESLGGLAQPLEVMVGVAESAGYVGLPEPLIEVAGISVPLLNELGFEDELTAVALGELSVGVISALQTYQSNAHFHDSFLVAGAGVDNLQSRSSLKLTPCNSIDPLRQLTRVELALKQNALADRANLHGAVLSAAQLLGLSRRMIDMSVEYAKERKQFGKPIGSFQAIKHHLANAYTQLEFARPMVQLAALQGGVAVHNAKIAAIDTATLIAETAIQVHGGMGYTYEVDLHLFMKRAWALSAEWGDRNYHMRKLEQYLFTDGATLGASQTFS